MRHNLLALTLVLVSSSTVLAQESVTVAGTKYATTITATVGSRMVKQRLTGAAVCRKLVFNVYTIGSYIDARANVRSAEELAASNAVKQLHLVIKRNISGRQMADALVAAVRKNYPAPAFTAELKTLKEKLQAISLIRQGQHIWLTHMPGVGFHGHLGGENQLFIKNPAFSRAVWEIYLGRNNLGSGIKAALVSRLK